jgi:tRNA 2-thiocytidine biosynthesis protein TtcA
MEIVRKRERLEVQLTHEVGRCISDFDLIRDGDRIMVCSSGGKDSYVLLDILERLRRRAPVRFTLVAVHLDQGIPGHDPTPLSNWLRDNGFEYHVLHQDIYRILLEKVPQGEIYCPLCSRLRRGILYNAAQSLGCTKMALGHNRDDTIETLMLNLIYAGSLKAIPAKLLSDDGRNTVIRPLLYSHEETIIEYAREVNFPPLLSCSLYDDDKQSKRREIKELLDRLEGIAPQAKNSIMAALSNVRATHLLDRDLWRRLGIDMVQKKTESA